MVERIVAPEILPRCPICQKRVLCFNDTELSAHVEKCFAEYLRLYTDAARLQN